MDATSLMQRSQSEELRHKQWKVIAERTPLESGYNIPGDFGMVAVYVEQAICAYVLPEVFSVNDVSANIDDLLNFLNGDDKLIPLDPDKYDCEGILSCAQNKINGKLYVRISIFPMRGKRKRVGGLCTILMYLVISELSKR